MHGPFTTSVARLSPELLSTIFRLEHEAYRSNFKIPSVRNPYEDTKENLLRDSHEPLRLGAVCKSWRKVAWGDSALWKYIYFGFTTDTEQMHARSLILKEWLARTDDERLHIRIMAQFKHDHNFTEEQKQLYTQILQIFADYADQWNSIILYLPKCDFIHALKGANGRIHDLKSVQIQIPNSSDSSSINETLDLSLLYDAPDLQHLILPQHITNDVTIELPWNQLRILGLVNQHVEVALLLLERTYALKEFYCELKGFNEYITNKRYPKLYFQTSH